MVDRQYSGAIIDETGEAEDVDIVIVDPLDAIRRHIPGAETVKKAQEEGATDIPIELTPEFLRPAGSDSPARGEPREKTNRITDREKPGYDGPGKVGDGKNRITDRDKPGYDGPGKVGEGRNRPSQKEKDEGKFGQKQEEYLCTECKSNVVGGADELCDSCQANKDYDDAATQ